MKNVFVISGSANDHSSSAPSTPSSVEEMVEDMLGVNASPGAGGMQMNKLDPPTIHIGSVREEV